MMEATQHCQRPWWKRPPVWLLGVVLLGALSYFVVKEVGRPALMPYGAFLDQVDSGNVASATFYGTEIDGRFKHPLSSGIDSGTSRRDSYRTRVPDFGDPELIPELRREHVAIDVSASSQWASVLARVPWPLLLFLAVALIAAVVRIVRGPKTRSGPAMPMRPGAGIIGLVSSLFGKPRQGEDQPPTKRPSDD
jgi:hypothetical protein